MLRAENLVSDGTGLNLGCGALESKGSEAVYRDTRELAPEHPRFHKQLADVPARRSPS